MNECLPWLVLLKLNNNKNTQVKHAQITKTKACHPHQRSDLCTSWLCHIISIGLRSQIRTVLRVMAFRSPRRHRLKSWGNKNCREECSWFDASLRNLRGMVRQSYMWSRDARRGRRFWAYVLINHISAWLLHAPRNFVKSVCMNIKATVRSSMLMILFSPF